MAKLVRSILTVVSMAAGAGLAWHPAASAQTPISNEVPAGAVPKADELTLRPELSRNVPSSALPDQAPPARELGKPSDDITLDVDRYVVDATAPPALQAALPALTAAFTGKGRSYEDLVNAVSAVTRYLQRDLGLYLGYAYLPEQSPQDGTIRIAVLEGRLDQVILKWRDDMPIDKSVVEAHLARLRSGDVLRVRDVERVVFLLNDLRGLNARFEVKEGRYPGTATLVVTPTPEKRISGKAEFDSGGSRYSGLYRLGATANIASPFRKGDGIVVSGQATTNGGLLFALAGYTMPVGTDGLKIGTSLSRVHYELIDEVPFDLNGDATAVSGYAIYPIIRSRNLNLFAQASVEQRDFIDRKGELTSAADIDKRVREFRLGIAGDFRDNLLSGGVNAYELAWSRANIRYETVGVQQIAIPRDFNKLTLGYSRLQNVVSNRLLAYVRYKIQVSDANLDTTERFSLGGPQGVRGFAPGEASGDEGILFTGELRFLPPESWFGRISREVVFAAFYDFGFIKFQHDVVTPAPTIPNPLGNTTTLSSWGIGATWDRPGAFGARLSLSWPINGDPQNDTVRRVPRAYATLTKYF
ncbi:MAG: ShlB/FhaC/HecB family hemolysin secretion/activation protein [Rubrivivax sp.]|nr:MAG: ShlB/FhaC/HecB family hemolysin secretion/activation protein [Rubrivivax sp.]